MTEVKVPKERKDAKKLSRAKPNSFSDENDKTSLYLSLALLLSIAVPFLYYSIQINIYAQQNQPEGFNFPHIFDFWRVLVGACVTQGFKHIGEKLTSPLFYNIAKVQDDEVLRQKYMKKGGENVYQQVQYIVISYWGYQVLKDSKFLPWFMGGQHSGKEAFESTMVNNPFCEFPREVYEWFLYASGLYFGELVRHVCWAERKNDFIEMLLHHSATVFLVFGSAYANQIGIGAIIAWLHLMTDIPVAAARILSTTHFDVAAVVVFVGGLLTSWFYFRLICLPWIIFNIFTSPTVVYPPHISEFDIFLKLNGLYLLVIQCLQVYWYLLFLKILYDYAVTGVAEDTQEKVEKTEKDQTEKAKIN